MPALGTLILQAAYLFLPLLVAAALAGQVQRYDLWTCLRQAIDGELTFRSHRLFGDHKTWRGAVCQVRACVRAGMRHPATGIYMPEITRCRWRSQHLFTQTDKEIRAYVVKGCGKDVRA